MKTFTKHNYYGTRSLTLGDSDNAIIFDSCNHAINFLLKTGLVCNNPVSVDFGLFVNGLEDADGLIKYSIFNFGTKAAIYAEESEDVDGNKYPLKAYFMTKKFADSVETDTAG